MDQLDQSKATLKMHIYVAVTYLKSKIYNTMPAIVSKDSSYGFLETNGESI